MCLSGTQHKIKWWNFLNNNWVGMIAAWEFVAFFSLLLCRFELFQNQENRCDFRDDVCESQPPCSRLITPRELSFLPRRIRAGPCGQSGGDRCDLGELGQCDFCLALSRLPCSGGSRPPGCEDTQAVLWRDLQGEQPRPPANSQPHGWVMEGSHGGSPLSSPSPAF